MGSLFEIVFTSTATDDLSRAELLELLKCTVEHNAREGITGLLLYRDRSFIQVLEGEEDAVFRLFAKIFRDPRHHHVFPLIHEPVEQRHFSESAMAFPDMGSPELRNLPGYSDFLNTPMNGDMRAKDIPKCKRLLLLFKQNMR